ncbi:MAG: cell wall-binding repeat-containing protein [Candidatus Nanohalobium sp.]
MKKTALLVAFIALVGFTSAAQHTEGSVNTAIVASSANYPDAFIGAAASNKVGAPILLTEKAQLSASTSNALENMSVDEVVILGGPAVVSEDVEAEINTMVNSTTRLWGVSQTGTSVEVSQYFWTESEEATIVQYPVSAENGYKLLSAVKNEVQDEDEPILISKPGTLSASVLSEVDRLNATEVEVYSTEAVNVSQDLKEIGVEDVEVTEGELEQVTEKVENKTTTANVSNLVVVAAANFRHSISVPTSANGASVIVSSESQISEAVKVASKASIKEIKVVGKPDLAQQIGEAIRNQTQKNVTVASGAPDDTAAEQALKHKKAWSQIQNKRLENWKEQVKGSKGLQMAANKTIVKAEAVVTVNSSEKAKELLNEAQAAYQEGDYFEARNKATAAISEASVNSFQKMSPGEVREEYRDELNDLKASVKEMKELNQKMAQKLKEADSKSERLEIVKEFKEERKEIRNEIREQKKEGKKEIPGSIPGDSKDDSSDNDSSKEDSETLDVGESEVEIEVEDNTVKSTMKFKAKNAGYSVNTNSNANDKTVSFSYEISSSNSPAAQVITDLNASASKSDLSPGNYTVKVAVSVDGSTINTVTEEVEITG